MQLPYILCFCRVRDRVLMLHRNRPPNKDLWNGIGGKIEEGESPEETLAREVLEEAGLDVKQAEKIFFGGVVTWTSVGDVENRNKGMYVYVVDFSDPALIFSPREIGEGKLEWKEVSWACDVSNKEVVENIPVFLPPMIHVDTPAHYHFIHEDGVQKGVEIKPLEF